MGFEQILGIRFTVNDITGRVRQYLPADRCFHANRFCQCVKSIASRNRICGRFDTVLVPAHLARERRGFWKLCHGGILEHVTPLWEGEVLSGRLYAGPFRWEVNEPLPASVFTHRADERALYLDPELYAELPLLDRARFEHLPTLLGALATELMRCVASREAVPDHERTRRWQIEYYLGLRFTNPIGLEDLAENLHLSVSRTGQIVRALFGKPFATVLREIRMRHARDLLTHTAFSVTEVAERCGFPDPGYFHRTFQRLHAETPLAYRRRHQREIPV